MTMPATSPVIIPRLLSFLIFPPQNPHPLIGLWPADKRFYMGIIKQLSYKNILKYGNIQKHINLYIFNTIDYCG